MGSIFKRTIKQPDGSVTTSKRWYIMWTDASGRRRKKAAYVDRAASLQLLAQKEKEAAQLQMGLADPFQEHASTPLSKHLEDFNTHLRDRGVGEQYRRQHEKQLSLAFKKMSATYPPDLTPEKAEKFLLYLTEDKGSAGRRETLTLHR